MLGQVGSGHAAPAVGDVAVVAFGACAKAPMHKANNVVTRMQRFVEVIRVERAENTS